MPTLAEVNDIFLEGAAELRYSYVKRRVGKKKETWTIEKPPRNVYSMSYYRTIKYARDFDPNQFMMVMDVDGPKVTYITVRTARALYTAGQRLFGIDLLLKGSGRKGEQAISDVQFPCAWSEGRCVQGLANIAWTLYKKARIPKHVVGFGRKLPGHYVDAVMFQRRRMVRGFCIHLGSGDFSVPVSPDDTAVMVQARMTMQYPILNVEIPVLEYKEIEDLLYEYVAEEEFTDEPSADLIRRLDELEQQSDRQEQDDTVYDSLPTRLQKIVNMTTDIHHDFKWPLVAFMRANLKMDPDDIIAWVWNNCQWHDLDSLSKTSYHVYFTSEWVDKVRGQRGWYVDKFGRKRFGGGHAVPRWVYG